MTDSDALMLIRGKIQCDIKSWTSVDGHGIIVEFRFPGKNLESYIEFDYPHNHLYFEILDMTDCKDGELIPLDSFRRKFIISEPLSNTNDDVFKKINKVLKSI